MNAPQELPSVRARLRAATHDIHQALHRAAPFAAIADGVATLESYGATLMFLHRFHSALSPLCKRGAQALGAPQLADAHVRRVAALESDLAYVGLKAGTPGSSVQVRGDAFCIGALYTVQGSTLGGKLIYRQLDALLPDASGRAFFKGSPEDSRDWQALCAALESYAGEQAEMETGALQAFGWFQDMSEK